MLEELGPPEDAPETFPGEMGDMPDVSMVEDFFAAWCGEREELNVDDDDLRHLGWREPVVARRYLEALRNLLENAAAYGARAAARVKRDDEEVRVVVEDEGPGIPEAALERVFEPFVHLEASRSRETGGSGLGLAIVRGHGGYIHLADRAEGGLRATVALPGAERP